MPKKTSWHEFAKKALKEIGKEWGYTVSESENVMFFAKKFSMVSLSVRIKGQKVTKGGASERKPQTMSYKPDVVWKKGRNYRAIFEIECLDETRSGIEKRKYAIGSLMLAYLAMIEKSAKCVVFVTNNKSLYREMRIFKGFIPLEYGDCIHGLYLRARTPLIMKELLDTYLSKALKR